MFPLEGLRVRSLVGQVCQNKRGEGMPTRTRGKTTTIGLPVTESREDQSLLCKLDKLKLKRGFRSRTSLLRVLIMEDADRLGVR